MLAVFPPPDSPDALNRAQVLLLGRLAAADPTAGVPNVFPAATGLIRRGLAELYLRGRLRITDAGREYLAVTGGVASGADAANSPAAN